MKTETSLKKSALARINQVIRESRRLHEVSQRLRSGFSKSDMAEVRDLAESITQCVHEFSAYTTALREKDEAK